MICWLNGALIDADRARIDPADRGFTLGDGLFETIAARAGAAMHAARHLDRLAAGAGVLGLRGADRAASEGALAAVIAANGPEGSLRVTLTRGPSRRGLLADPEARPTLLVTWHDAAVIPDQVTAIISAVTRRNEASPLTRIKSLNYGDAVLARMQAAAAGAEDAVLLNTRGTIAGASAANLFALRDGRLITPPVADGALPGIARSLILERAGAAEATLSIADTLAADAVFLTNSLGIRALAQLDATSFNPAPALLAHLRLAVAA